MKDETVYLKHILDAIKKIESYTSGGRKAFFQNTMIQDAVIRNLPLIPHIHPREDLRPAALRSILRDTRISEKEFLEAL